MSIGNVFSMVHQTRATPRRNFVGAMALCNALVDNLREKYHYSRYRIFKAMLQHEGRDLLDIGCGSPCDSMKPGAFLQYMGYGTGLDIVEHDLSFPFQKGSIVAMPFADRSFDAVVAGEVLEHIVEIEQAIREVKRVLKSSGVFVISTPTHNILFRTVWFFWERSFGRMWKDAHLTKYTSRQWIDLLSRHFTIEKVVNHLSMTIVIKMRV